MSAAFFGGNYFEVIFVHILLLIIKISLTVERNFFFYSHFRTKFVIRKEKYFVSCFSYFSECSQIFKINENFETVRRCFLRYFIEEESR